jgi:hypothetical protein
VAALTLAALTASGGPTRYVDAWMNAAGFQDDRLFRLYVVLFLIDFMSELPIRFASCGCSFSVTCKTGGDFAAEDFFRDVSWTSRDLARLRSLGVVARFVWESTLGGVPRDFLAANSRKIIALFRRRRNWPSPWCRWHMPG